MKTAKKKRKIGNISALIIIAVIILFSIFFSKGIANFALILAGLFAVYKSFKFKKEKLGVKEYENFLRWFGIGGSLIATAVCGLFTYIYITQLEIRGWEWNIVGTVFVTLTVMALAGFLYSIGRVIFKRSKS